MLQFSNHHYSNDTHPHYQWVFDSVTALSKRDLGVYSKQPVPPLLLPIFNEDKGLVASYATKKIDGEKSRREKIEEDEKRAERKKRKAEKREIRKNSKRKV